MRVVGEVEQQMAIRETIQSNCKARDGVGAQWQRQVNKALLGVLDWQIAWSST